ncbi:MAG: Hpt domain-containing protein [Usitatibacter sp.]
MAETTIDPSTFKALQDAAGVEFVAELVDTFLEEAPRMMAELESALATRDAEAFRRAAHSLKSNSYTFGAVALGARAKELELGGFEAAAKAPELRQEFERVATALRGLRDA